MSEATAKKDAGYIQNLWRPMMGWMYMLICLLDMAIFPVLWSLLQAVMHQPITQWNPLTLQGAGLFHIAMGAVLGISAFGRTQEKLAGTAANPTTTSQISTTNTNISGASAGMNNGGFNGGSSNGGFGGSTGGFGGSAGGFGSTPSPSGFGSTPSPTSSGGFGGSSGFGAPATPAVNANGQKVVPQTAQPLL
jgi:hypothetical protein